MELYKNGALFLVSLFNKTCFNIWVSGTSAAVALLPVFFFTIWGSADRQGWATIHSSQTISTATMEDVVKEKKPPVVSNPSQDGVDDGFDDDESVVSALRLRMFLNNQDSTDEDEVNSVGDVEAGHKSQKL